MPASESSLSHINKGSYIKEPRQVVKKKRKMNLYCICIRRDLRRHVGNTSRYLLHGRCVLTRRDFIRIPTAPRSYYGYYGPENRYYGCNYLTTVRKSILPLNGCTCKSQHKAASGNSIRYNDFTYLSYALEAGFTPLSIRSYIGCDFMLIRVDARFLRAVNINKIQ